MDDWWRRMGLRHWFWRDRSCTCQRSRREYPCFDNEVYSNTGGQTSKATPASAIAKFRLVESMLQRKI